MRIYECPKHGDSFLNDGTCEDCTRILKVIEHNKEVSSRTPKRTRILGRNDVHWPGVGPYGRTVENLEHTPRHFGTKREFRDYLKSHNVNEAG